MDAKDLAITTGAATLLSSFLNHLLSTSAKREEIRYQRLYERQAIVIARTYKRLVRFLLAVEEFTKGDELAVSPKVQETGRDFKEYFLENSIYIPNDLNMSVQVIDIILGVTADFWSAGRMLERQPDDLRKEIEPYLTRVKQSRDQLRRDFHNVLLGRHRGWLRSVVRRVKRGVRASCDV